MASLIEAIDIKRKMFFEYENAPFHCIDVEVSRPTARGGLRGGRLALVGWLSLAAAPFARGQAKAEALVVATTTSRASLSLPPSSKQPSRGSIRIDRRQMVIPSRQ